jgi:Protein of unknown function (DUF4242)
MPKFLDFHRLKGLSEEAVREAANQPKDEFGVTTENLIYSEEEDKFYCLLDAPNEDAIIKHHAKFGFKCEWISEVKTTANKIPKS